MTSTESHYFKTDDDVRLHYLEATSSGCYHGSEHVLLLLPGWSQTSRQFVHQIEYFSSHQSPFGRVIALDPRGHGESDKANHGYRLARLAKDLDNFLDHLECRLGPPILFHALSHSAHCAVLWSYVELFGCKRFQSMVWVDQLLTAISRDPHWTTDECDKFGVLKGQNANDVRSFVDTVAYGGEGGTRKVLRGMFSDQLDDEEFDSIVADNLKFPRSSAAEMVWNVLNSDFRDVLAMVDIPVLCIGGADSHISSKCVQYQANQVQLGEVTIVPGTHFMFYEEHESFNEAVDNFYTDRL